MHEVTQVRPSPQPRRRLDRPAAWVLLGMVAVIGATILSAGLLIVAVVSTLNTPATAWVWYAAALLCAAAAVAASVWLNRINPE